MIDEADELPVAQVDQPLRHVVCHVDDCNLFVAWSERLVGEKRVIHDPGLGDGLLWVVERILPLDVVAVFLIDYVCAPHVEFDVAVRVLRVQH